LNSKEHCAKIFSWKEDISMIKDGAKGRRPFTRLEIEGALSLYEANVNRLKSVRTPKEHGFAQRRVTQTRALLRRLGPNATINRGQVPDEVLALVEDATMEADRIP
jgi:hypothetical protein